MASAIAHVIGTIIGHIIIGLWIVGIIGTILLIAVGFVLFIVINAFGPSVTRDNYVPSVGSNHIEDVNDESMYACTGEWRSLHPYDYNPVTGGSSAEEDHKNGW